MWRTKRIFSTTWVCNDLIHVHLLVVSLLHKGKVCLIHCSKFPPRTVAGNIIYAQRIWLNIHYVTGTVLKTE